MKIPRRAGNWEEWFSDISFYRTDGTIDPIYHRQTNVSYSGWGLSGVTNQKFEINVSPNLQWEMADNTTYYIGDQTGSVREEFGGEGWPVSSSVFYPFGVEQTTTTDPNSNKFATLERDSESNLDHATFRQYTPLASRWMSPDPYNGSYDLNNPQSFNRYAYVVMNSPLGSIDPAGLYETTLCNSTPYYVDGVYEGTDTVCITLDDGGEWGNTGHRGGSGQPILYPYQPPPDQNPPEDPFVGRPCIANCGTQPQVKERHVIPTVTGHP